MPTPLRPLPPQLGAAFTLREARALGVHPRRLTHGDVTRIAPGYYARAPIRLAPGDEPSARPADQWAQRQRALAMLIGPHLPPGVFFVGRTAAALWRLPVPLPRQLGSARSESAALSLGGLDLGCLAPNARLVSRGFNASCLRPHSVTVVTREGLRLIDPASIWATLAPGLGRDDAVALGDAVIRETRIPGTLRLKRAPHADLSELERLALVPHRRGGRLLREYLPLLSPHSASPPERHLRLCLHDWRAPEPQLDYDVYSAGGVLLGASEFAYPEFRFALEYEGDHHRSEARQWYRDIEKYQAYQAEGWEVFRVTARALYTDRAQLRAQLLARFRHYGWTQ